MTKALLFLSTALLLSGVVNAQHVYDGDPLDSLTYTFEVTDSLTRPGFATIDTSNSSPWIIGTTHKSFFADSASDQYAIMTDTTNPYPVNTNSSFILKLQSTPYNIIIDFWHKYQTDSGKDGGIVEFSRDSGTTWENVLGDCNADSGRFASQGILTDNFYGKYDTLTDGTPAFTGTSNGWQYSRLQFFSGIPIRKTGGGGCYFYFYNPIYLRFRFQSDSVADTLAGWIIDNIKIEQDHYSGFVSSVRHSLDGQIYPNPSSGIFNFPALNNEKNCTIEISNAIGQTIVQTPYQHKIDLSTYPKGVYFYKVVNETEYFSGHLVVQ